MQRTGTDNLPILNQPAQAGGTAGAAAGLQQPEHAERVAHRRTQSAAAKVDALASNGMDEIEIPAFLRKQAD